MRAVRGQETRPRGLEVLWQIGSRAGVEPRGGNLFVAEASDTHGTPRVDDRVYAGGREPGPVPAQAQANVPVQDIRVEMKLGDDG